MNTPTFFEPIDYLAIGHISCDLTPTGKRIGGSVSYSALTAHSLGLKVGIVTVWGEDVSLGPLSGIPIAGSVCEKSTTISNQETKQGRIQSLHHIAPSINYHHIPKAWRKTPIVHLGPIAQEISPTIIRKFPRSFVGITAQGWLRSWDENGSIFASEWPFSFHILGRADAVIFSIEDVGNELNHAETLSAHSQLLAVTLGNKGAKVFYCEEERTILAPSSEEIDSIGAGDIFSASFFIHYHKFGNPWKAAQYANHLASASVRQIGLASATTIGSPTHVDSKRFLNSQYAISKV